MASRLDPKQFFLPQAYLNKLLADNAAKVFDPSALRPAILEWQALGVSPTTKGEIKNMRKEQGLNPGPRKLANRRVDI